MIRFVRDPSTEGEAAHPILCMDVILAMDNPLVTLGKLGPGWLLLVHEDTHRN